MRVLLITQGFSPILQEILKSHHQIIGIAEDGPRISLSKYQKALKKILNLIYHLINPNHEILSYFCKKNNIPYFYINSIQDIKFKNWVISMKPDIIAVYSMSHLLKKTIFSIPKYGAINLHPSLLPSYRGPNPYFWEYYNMDLISGVTIHYIDEGEDTGDIIFQEQIPVQLGIPLDKLRYIKINILGTKLLLNALNEIESGKAPRIPQPIKSPTQRARNLEKGEEKRIIEWENWDVERIWHLIQGFLNIYDFISYRDKPPVVYKVIPKYYDKCFIPENERGHIGINPDGSRYICCSNGKIIYEFQFSPWNIVKNILLTIKRVIRYE